MAAEQGNPNLLQILLVVVLIVIAAALAKWQGEFGPFVTLTCAILCGMVLIPALLRKIGVTI